MPICTVRGHFAGSGGSFEAGAAAPASASVISAAALLDRKRGARLCALVPGAVDAHDTEGVVPLRRVHRNLPARVVDAAVRDRPEAGVRDGDLLAAALDRREGLGHALVVV